MAVVFPKYLMYHWMFIVHFKKGNITIEKEKETVYQVSMNFTLHKKNLNYFSRHDWK